MRPTAAEITNLRGALAGQLERMAELIHSVPDNLYTLDRADSGSAGAHFRHMIEIAGLLVEGIGTGRVDYADRARDSRIEADRDLAAAAVGNLAQRVAALPRGIGNRRLFVRSEIDTGQFMSSTVDREIEFVTSHTIHHLALVREKLSASGFQTDPEIGLAPATSRYRTTRAAAKAGEQICRKQ